MRHIDLFSGIGGFAYAAKQVWGVGYENIFFCENNKFCQQVLKKNFGKDILIYDDIKDVNNTATRKSGNAPEQEGRQDFSGRNTEIDLLTGGFPCQPFSIAGRRKGKGDDRYLWHEMFRVISEFKPCWVIGENVTGIINMVLREAQADLESEGYEVQCFIIPACAINAPHRRDRVWIIAHRNHEGQLKCGTGDTNKNRTLQDKQTGEKTWSAVARCNENDSSGDGKRLQNKQYERFALENRNAEWDKNWIEIAQQLCRMGDGLPVTLDRFKLSAAGHRRERLKALGNSIVPAIATQIMTAIKESVQ